MKSKKLIRNYINNNELDIKKIVDEYSRYIYIVIKNSSKEQLCDEDIEEIISDVFFILWKNKEKLDINKSITNYLVGIIKNLVKEKYRNFKFSIKIEEYDNLVIEDKKINNFLEINEQEEIIEKSLNCMNNEDIKIFTMFYYYGKKIKEIAKILNVSETKVKTKLHRIRNKIKKDLEKGGYGNGR